MQRFTSAFKQEPRLPLDYDDLKPKKSYRKDPYWKRKASLAALSLVVVVLIILGLTGSFSVSRGSLNEVGDFDVTDDLDGLDDPLVSSPSLSEESGDVEEARDDEAAIDTVGTAVPVSLEVTDDDPMPDSVEEFDLASYQGSLAGINNRERILLLIPLRNCEKVLPLMFRNMMNMTYNHDLIDVSFLVSDCSKGDKTLETLTRYTKALQQEKLLPLLEDREKRQAAHGVFGSSDLYEKYMPEDYLNTVKKSMMPPYHDGYQKPFHSIEIYQKDFGQVIGQGFSDRHDVKIQGIRRKLMGRSRNWLLTAALKPYHSWVYWRDVDIETSPGDILQFMMRFGKDFDVIVPNVWRPLPTFLGNEQPYDLNSWIESDQGLALAKSLDEDDVIVEGYAEYPTWRAHLAYIRNPEGNPNEIVALDGVGGVSILAKAQVFRAGVTFPAFTFMNHAETEAFGKMSRQMGFNVGGLPHYTIWHIYEPSQDDLQEISKLERKKRRFGRKGGS